MIAVVPLCNFPNSRVSLDQILSASHTPWGTFDGFLCLPNSPQVQFLLYGCKSNHLIGSCSQTHLMCWTFHGWNQQASLLHSLYIELIDQLPKYILKNIMLLFILSIKRFISHLISWHFGTHSLPIGLNLRIESHLLSKLEKKLSPCLFVIPPSRPMHCIYGDSKKKMLLKQD